VKRIAVTGASGFIGRHVTEALAARGDQPIPIPRPFLRSTLASRFDGCDAVVHLAGVIAATRDADFYRANVDGTRVVAEAAADAGARLIDVSSLAAAGPASPASPRTEDDPPAPVNAYGRSKLEGERAVAAVAGLRWTVLRPGVVYGPQDRALRPLFQYARRGLAPLVGAPDAAYTFIYIADAVRAILAGVDRGGDRDVVFLGHPDPVSPRYLIETIRELAGSRAAILPIPRAITRLAAELGELSGVVTGRPATINRRRFAELYSPGFVCCVDRMKEHLGVTAEVGLRSGLTHSAEWYLKS